MPAGTFRDRARAVPLGLLGMVVCIGIVETLLAQCEGDLLQPIQMAWRLQGRASRNRAVRSEILCFGDSLVQYGVIPSVLEGRLGRRACNLALGGGQFPANYFFLRRALDAGARPSALILDALPLQLKLPTSHKTRLWSDLLGLREASEVAWATRDPGFLASTLLSRPFKSYQSRLEIRQYILSSLAGASRSSRDDNAAVRRNMVANRGALIMGRNPHFRVDARHERWVYPKDVEIDSFNGHYLHRFLELAEERDIPVFWLLTPVCSAIQAKGEASGAIEAQGRFLRDLQARYPGITVLDGRRSAYPDEAMDDSIHLARPGAAIFSADLADAVARALDDAAALPRWVQLPEYRERPIPGRFEDLGESRMASTSRVIK